MNQEGMISMDERENYETGSMNTADTPTLQTQSNTGNNKPKWLFPTVLLAALAGIGIIAGIALYPSFPKGCEDYTVLKEQYYVEYSEKYDYGEVLTVEYPRIEGLDEAIQEPLNQLLYNTALDRVTYWHLEPSEDVKAFQEEFFSIFASDVNCDVTYHSQYLLSVDFREYYSAGNPLWMTNGTEKSSHDRPALRGKLCTGRYSGNQQRFYQSVG